MKKKGFIGRLAAVAVVLCLITMSLTAGTLAKYASEKAGNAVATVAKWSVKFTDGETTPTDLSDSFTLNLQDTALADNMVADGKIAPGTKGAFKLAVDGTGTEVAFKYTIELNLSGTGLDKAPIKFYSDNTYNTELTPDATSKKITVTGDVALADVATAVTETIYWKWDSTAYDTTITEEDKRDTKVGEDSAALTDGLKYTIPVTIRAEQNITEKTVSP